jgi:plasmid stability protein
MLALLSLLAYLCYFQLMATITIRNLDEKVKRELQVRAALNGRSMEAEARELISGSIMQGVAESQEGLATAIRRRFAALGAELVIPPRQFSGRPIPKFDE